MPPSIRSPTRFQGVTSLLAGRPWAIREADHRELVAAFNRYLAGGVDEATLAQLRADREARAAQQQEQQAAAPGVAVIGIYGTIVPRGSLMAEYCGATDPHTLADRVTEAANDDGVTSIVLDILSGGGAVTGIRVAEEAIRRAREVKPVIAVANTVMCSAALWLGAQATELVAAPGAEIGSIGVIGTHVDETAALDEYGLKVTYVRSNPGKALGQSAEAMEGDVLASWQDEIDRTQADFVQALSLGRGMSLADAQALATGHVWFGEEAVAAGLADRVATLGDVLREQQAQAAQRSVRTARRAADHPRVVEATAQLRQAAVRARQAFTPEEAEAERAALDTLRGQLQGALPFADEPLAASLTALLREADSLTARFAAPPPPTPSEEDPPMKITLQDRAGAAHEFDAADTAALQRFLAEQDRQALAAGRQQEREAVATALGLEPKDVKAERLTALAAQAQDGEAYRDSLLDEVEQLALTVTGDEAKAARIRRANAALDIDSLKDAVQGYRDQRDALVPAGRQSMDPPAEAPKKTGQRPKPKKW